MLSGNLSSVPGVTQLKDFKMQKAVLSLVRIPLAVIYRLIGPLFYQDEMIPKRLARYFPSYRSFLGESLNQLLRCMGSTRSFLPQGIIIEPTNCCNLKCNHCTTQRADEKKGYMDYDFYKTILDHNPQLTSIILTRNGEPLLHPNIFKMIRYAREKNIYVSIYTNGVLLSKEGRDGIFDSDLSEINFSMEGVGTEYERNRLVSYKTVKENLEYIIQRRNVLKSELVIGINVTKITDDDKAIKMIRKEWQERVDHIFVEPLMGRRPFPRTRACRTLWRNAVIRWDGTVLPCCIDVSSTLVLGDLKKDDLVQIFNGSQATAIRKSHLDGKFPPVCKLCDEISG